jgi:hypothetical protein
MARTWQGYYVDILPKWTFFKGFSSLEAIVQALVV